MPRPGRHHHKGPHRRRSGGRRRSEGGEWNVEAPISRFVEPAVLLALREGSSHGYDLAEVAGDLIGIERVDYGNLYRLLRSLEADQIVTSVWDDQLPGRSKRIYELTPQGARLLDSWIEALETTQERLEAFLEIYRKGRS